MRTCLGIKLRNAETKAFEQTSTKILAMPIAREFSTELVTASTGQRPSTNAVGRMLNKSAQKLLPVVVKNLEALKQGKQ
jgi:hypothetical protein